MFGTDGLLDKKIESRTKTNNQFDNVRLHDLEPRKGFLSVRVLKFLRLNFSYSKHRIKEKNFKEQEREAEIGTYHSRTQVKTQAPSDLVEVYLTTQLGL